MTYLLTLRCYGTWLHGDEQGSVDRAHNIPGSDLLKPDRARQRASELRMSASPMIFDEDRRAVVQQAVEDVVQYRGWTLHALAVRVNHIHQVVSAPVTPSVLLHDCKFWSTRRLRECGLVNNNQPVWARHGSTRYLNTTESVTSAVHYVMEGQGAAINEPRL